MQYWAQQLYHKKKAKLAQEVLYHLHCSTSYICKSSFRSSSWVNALYCPVQYRKTQIAKTKECTFEYLEIYIRSYCLWVSFLSNLLHYKKYSSFGTCETFCFSLRMAMLYHSEQGFMEHIQWRRTPKPKQVRFIQVYTKGKWQHLSYSHFIRPHYGQCVFSTDVLGMK